ncbi:hypothetical protein VCCP1040_2514, partial [Vibrio cholerae CP1040(13)]
MLQRPEQQLPLGPP